MTWPTTTGFKHCNCFRDMLVRGLIYFRGKPVETLPGEQKQQSDEGCSLGIGRPSRRRSVSLCGGFVRLELNFARRSFQHLLADRLRLPASPRPGAPMAPAPASAQQGPIPGSPGARAAIGADRAELFQGRRALEHHQSGDRLTAASTPTRSAMSVKISSAHVASSYELA